MNTSRARTTFIGITLVSAVALVGAYGAALTASTASAQVAGMTAGPTVPCTVLTRNLYYGSVGSDVASLQTFLKADGYYSGAIVGRFGPVTYHSVQQFQMANGISPTGGVGPITRARIQQIGCSTIPPVTGSVTVRSLTPQSGPVGTQVTITGFGFTNDNTIHFGYGAIVHVPIASSIAVACTTDPSCIPGIRQTLVFTVPSSLDPLCRFSTPQCMIASQMTTPGNYNVYVDNSNGTSNSMNYTVTSGTQNNLSISSIAPTSGPVGTEVTLNGSGFHSGDIVQIGSGAITNITVINSNTITFTLPQGVGAYCHAGVMCPTWFMQLTPGTYSVVVQDPATGETSNNVSFTVTANSGNNLSISGLDAPTTLALGVQGTWTVHVNTSSLNPTLHYSITWGDENLYGYSSIMAPQPATIQTFATFTHAYQRSGTYTPVFTVTDDFGHTQSTSATVVITPLY